MVEGLNAAGFSSKDYRAQDENDRDGSELVSHNDIQMHIDDLEKDAKYSSMEEMIESKQQEGRLWDFLPYKTNEEKDISVKNDIDISDMVRAA